MMHCNIRHHPYSCGIRASCVRGRDMPGTRGKRHSTLPHHKDVEERVILRMWNVSAQEGGGCGIVARSKSSPPPPFCLFPLCPSFFLRTKLPPFPPLPSPVPVPQPRRQRTAPPPFAMSSLRHDDEEVDFDEEGERGGGDITSSLD